MYTINYLLRVELQYEPLFILVAAAVVVPSFFFGASGGFVVAILVKVLPRTTVLLCDAGTGSTLLLWVSNCKTVSIIYKENFYKAVSEGICSMAFWLFLHKTNDNVSGCFLVSLINRTRMGLSLK